MSQARELNSDHNRDDIQFLAGQVHALMGFALAIINTHPSPRTLARQLDLVGQVTLARSEASTVSDDFVEGVQNVQDRLETGVQIALGRRAAPKKARGRRKVSA